MSRQPLPAIDPLAETRLELFACGEERSWIREEIASDASKRVQRHTSISDRAYAVVAVIHRKRVLAHLIGSGQRGETTPGASDGDRDRLAIGRSARWLAVQDLVEDLAEQIDPLPTLVQRRIYPNAPDGTERALTTHAVRAEQSGDLAEALRWAEAAFAQKPTPKTAAYVAELHHRRWRR